MASKCIHDYVSQVRREIGEPSPKSWLGVLEVLPNFQTCRLFRWLKLCINFHRLASDFKAGKGFIPDEGMCCSAGNSAWYSVSQVCILSSSLLEFRRCATWALMPSSGLTPSVDALSRTSQGGCNSLCWSRAFLSGKPSLHLEHTIGFGLLCFSLRCRLHALAQRYSNSGWRGGYLRCSNFAQPVVAHCLYLLSLMLKRSGLCFRNGQPHRCPWKRYLPLGRAPPFPGLRGPFPPTP